MSQSQIPHTTEILQACAEVMRRARAGEASSQDNLVVNASRVMVKIHCAKMAHAVHRKERPCVLELMDHTDLSASAVRLAKAGANKRATANSRS